MTNRNAHPLSGTKDKAEDNDRLLNVNEAADLLGISAGTLYHWVSERRVPHVKLGIRCLRFRRASLETWVAECASDCDKRAAAISARLLPKELASMGPD
jgi:excisionase family DNA binding protein